MLRQDPEAGVEPCRSRMERDEFWRGGRDRPPVWLNSRVLAVRADDVPGDQGVAAILRHAT